MSICWRALLWMVILRICGIMVPLALASRAKLVMRILMRSARRLIIGGTDMSENQLSSLMSGKSVLASFLAIISRFGLTGIHSRWKSKGPRCRCKDRSASLSPPITPLMNVSGVTECYAQPSIDVSDLWISDWFPTMDPW